MIPSKKDLFLSERGLFIEIERCFYARIIVVMFNVCTVNGEKVTAENAATFFPKLDMTKVTIR